MSKTFVTKSGRRLTEADIERLADQAERGFDLSTWKPRPGRPRLGAAPGSRHSPRLVVRLPEELRERVTARAAREGRTISDVVRELLEDYAHVD